MTYVYYQDQKGEWRWRLKAANGKIVADSAESYTTKQECRDDIELVKKAATSPVVEDD